MSYELILSALKQEAEKWDDLADAVRPVHRWVESATLGMSAFFIVDVTGLARLLTLDNPVTALIMSETYENCRSQVEAVLQGAVTEFEQIGDALTKTVKAYRDAEEIVEGSLDYDKIYTA